MTTTVTQTKLVAPEGVLRPRPYVVSGYKTHVAAEQPSWPSAQEEYERGLAADRPTIWSGSFWLACALGAVAAVLISVGVVLWP